MSKVTEEQGRAAVEALRQIKEYIDNRCADHETASHILFDDGGLCDLVRDAFKVYGSQP